jgi:molybdenum cofactor synthesis domain-containing protein
MPDSKDRIYSAAVLIIGNEILSGRTQDTNLKYLANGLNTRGIQLREARVIPDIADAIVVAVNELRTRYDYVFTTGGIGPTHDDITARSMALAFGVSLECNPQALKRLTDYYHDELNEARKRMATIPKGGILLDNPVSQAPGFQLENVYVLPGVPRIMQAMFDGFAHRLTGGQPMLTRTINAFVTESQVAEQLSDIQKRYPEVELGSYPYVRNHRFGAALVVRTMDKSALDAAAAEITELVQALGEEPVAVNEKDET